MKLRWGIGGMRNFYNLNTSISKIIDLIRPVDEWSEMAFSTQQNSENEHCETLQKQVNKLNFHH